MTFEKIKYFYDIVRCGSFTAAAQENYITQATISQQIAAMEQELGFKLMERTTRGIALTEQGTSFYTDCQPILLSYTQAVGRAKAKGSSAQVHFPLGVVAGFEMSRVCKVFQRTLEDYPTGRCTVYYESPMRLKTEFTTAAIAAVIAMPYDFIGDASGEYEVTPLFSCGYDLIVGKDHPLAGRSSVKVEMLSDERFVVNSESVMGPKAYGRIVTEQMQNRHRLYNITVEANQVTRELIVASQRACMLLPHCVHLSSTESLIRLPITDYHETCDFALISRCGEAISSFLQDFIEHLKEEYFTK